MRPQPSPASPSVCVLLVLACSSLLAACRDTPPVPPAPEVAAAGLQLDTRSGTVTERGGQATFQVSLVRAPEGVVVLDAQSSDLSEGRVSSGTLTFTPDNWRAPQALVITGVDDAEVDGDQPFQVTLSVTRSAADSAFASLAAEVLTLTAVDDETAGVTVGTVQGAATERGGQATFDVVLNAAPASDVTVELASGRPQEGLVSPASLRFTRDNWNAPQAVTVTGQDDAVADGPQTLEVRLTFRSTAPGYATLPVRTVVVSNADDDTASIRVSAATGPTAESGAQASFTVVLGSQPTADVTLRVSTSDASEGTLGIEALTFTPANWAAPQTVNVTGVDDAVADGSQPYTVDFAAVQSADSGYAALAVPGVALLNSDDDSAGIRVSAPSGDTAEDGTQATFSVVLGSQPTADVTLGLTSTDPTEGTLAAPSLTFTPANWAAPQTVRVTGVDDAQADGRQPYAVRFGAPVSSDAAYAALSLADVALHNADDDSAGFRVTLVHVNSTESGGPAAFRLALASEPSADVTVQFVSTDAGEGVPAVASLTFTPANWAAPQTVSVVGQDDDVADGTQPYTVAFGATLSADAAYAALRPADLELINEDDDTAGITVSAATALTTEAGGTAAITVALRSQPTADVTVRFHSSDVAEATLDVDSLTFTPANWRSARTVTATGVQDLVADGEQPWSLVFEATLSTDAAYAALTPAKLVLGNADDDSAGIDVGVASGATTEAGGAATIAVRLTSQPRADVTVHFDSDDASEGTVQVKSLTFTPESWARAQSIVVRGADDLDTDGDQPYAVRFTATTSTDAAYAALLPAPVALSNTDDDVAVGLVLTAPAAATAGEPFEVMVRAVDASGRTVIGYTGTAHFTSGDAAAQLPADFAFGAADQGSHRFSVELRSAGTHRVDVQDAVRAWTAGAALEVSAAAASQLVFTQQPADAGVREVLPAVGVAAHDAFGNATVLSDVDVTLGLVAEAGASLPLQGTTTVQLADGTARFSALSVTDEGRALRLTAQAPLLAGATSAPFTVTDARAPALPTLTAVRTSASSVTVTWTSVGDDGSLGTAAAHALRYALAPIGDEATFSAATDVALPFAPAPAGTVQSFTVTGLTLTADHHFALRVADGAGNSSRSASVRVKGDLCEGVTCTAPATACSADGTTVLTFASSCQPDTGTCQDVPATATHCQSYETCSAGACVPVTPGAQAGSVIISEFRSLGSELIELKNTTGADVDVAGYTLRNAAGVEARVRAVSDPNGTAGTPVLIPAGGALYGVANPPGAIPAGVGFVYGAPGTSFALADTGDALALYRATGHLEDAVDFRSFVSNPDQPLTASHFVGYAGSSTQLEPTASSAAGNDGATNWCVSFYAAGVRGARVTGTEGAANGSCKVAVLNELMIDPVGNDDGKGFIELAGPGGSLIGGAQLIDVEGLGASAGTVNTVMGTLTLPAGTRFPADGILLVADGLGTTATTQVPNFVAGVDVLLPSVDPENSGGDAVQLVSASGQLLDTVGYDATGANLATNVATANGLPLYETATALFQGTGSTVTTSLMRSPESRDTSHNRNDFRMDPTPTPGLPNDLVNFTVSRTLTPKDVPHTVSSVVTITGTDFGPTLTAKVTTSPATACTVVSNTQATCTVPAQASSGFYGMLLSNGAAVGAPDTSVSVLYTAALNETNNAAEADFCNLQFPGSFQVTAGQPTPWIYGRLFENGLTNTAGQPIGVKAEVGYGPAGTDPRTNAWRFFAAAYNIQVGNDDEFQGSFTAPAAGTYGYTFRFTLSSVETWTYCDLNGAGSNAGFDFASTQLGVMTVTP